MAKKMKDKFIKERLETHLNFLDPIKRSKVKTFESADKKFRVKTSDKRLSIKSRETKPFHFWFKHNLYTKR